MFVGDTAHGGRLEVWKGRALTASILVLTFAAREAAATPPADDPTPEWDADYHPGQRGETTHGDWMGAFWGLELRGGLHLRADDPGLSPAPLFGIGLRAATLMTLLDLELYAQTAPFGEADGPHDLWRTSFGADLKLHPLFIRALHANLGARLLAGLHLAVGLGGDLLAVGAPGAATHTHAAFAFAFGAGAEVPLTGVDDGGPSVWLGLGWRMRFADFDAAPPALRDMDSHEVVLSLGVRFHDIGFLRLPRPPELDDRDR